MAQTLTLISTIYPLNHLDRFGLATESNSDKFDGYMYGEVESHCYCEKSIALASGVGTSEKLQARIFLEVTYLDDFEQRYPNYEVWKIFDLNANGFPNLPDDLGI